MLELGQPMHAFDTDTLSGGIVVRRAQAGETPEAARRRDVALDPEFLVITDEGGALALAGVMGGFDSRVTDTTRNVFLEGAHFAPAAIIGRARKLGLHTDASHRFERGVDPQLPRCRDRARHAVAARDCRRQRRPDHRGAACRKHLPSRAPITLRRERLARVLDLVVADAEVERILVALGMAVEPSADGWHATPPTRRFDIAIEEDLIEEVARIHGYERVPDARAAR